jgi:F0F1-type ATP synthase assembly protein I
MSGQPEKPPEKGTGKKPGEGASEKAWQETVVLLARLSGIGWYVAGSIGLGVGGGWFLDRQLNTRPVFTLIGLGLGVLAAFTGMIRLLNQFGKKRQ